MLRKILIPPPNFEVGDDGGSHRFNLSSIAVGSREKKSLERVLSGYLPPLLMTGKHVHLTGIGSFQLVYVSARLDHDRDEIVPPAEQLVFVPGAGTIDPDPTLVRVLELSQGIKTVKARKRVLAFCQGLQKTLQEKGRLDLPGLGRVHLNDYGQEYFEPSRASQGLTSYFALPTLRLPSQSQKLVASSVAPITTSVIPDNSPEPQNISDPEPAKLQQGQGLGPARILLWAFLIGVGGLLTYLVVSSGKQPVASHAAIATAKTTSKRINEAPLPRAEPPAKVVPARHIVLGAFREPANAKRLTQSLEKQGLIVRTFSGELIKIAIEVPENQLEEKLKWAKQTLTPEAWVLPIR